MWPRWPHGAYHCTGPLALLCFPVYPLLGQPLPSASLNCVSSFPRWIMPVVYGRRRVSGFIIYMDMCAHTRCCSCMPAPTFTTAKGQAFLTVPSFPSEKPVTLCVSKDKQSHRLVGTSETFYESHSPHLVTLSFPVAHPHAPSSTPSPFSVLFLSVFSFLSVAQPRSLTSNCRHRQSHLDYPWDQPGLTSLPVKEETAIPRDPRQPSTPNFRPRPACLGL